MPDNALRLQYLQAMGIDVWVPKLAQDPNATQTQTAFSEPENYPRIEQNEHLINTPDWETLTQTISNCQRCSLATPAKQPTIGHGNPNARWLLITATPNDAAETDASLLIHEMLRAIGINPNDYWITSAVKCPLPEKRLPQQHELAECRLFLEQQIACLQPDIMVLFGETAAQSLLQTGASLVELRGKIHKFAAISTIVTYHPHFLLHAQLEKRNAWIDLQLALTAYHEVNRL